MLATFVNYKTAFEVTKDPKFEAIKNERVEAVSAKFAEEEQAFASERDAALAEAKGRQDSLAGELPGKEAEMNAANTKRKADIKEAGVAYKAAVKEAKAKHAAIKKDEIAKIEKTYKDMWEKEKADYKESMLKNKDPESRRARKMAYVSFKESFPQMKANDLERRTNALEFDKETELNGLKAHYTQQKGLLKDEIAESKKAFDAEYRPYDALVKEYGEKEKELKKRKEEALLRANLLFFFKFGDYYEVIPDDITNKIIQGLGEKVFTKVFRIEVPHDGSEEREGTMPFKVVALVNFGDVKFYKCVGTLMGEKVVVYVRKVREIEIGADIRLAPDLVKAEIYEDERNIRLY